MFAEFCRTLNIDGLRVSREQLQILEQSLESDLQV